MLFSTLYAVTFIPYLDQAADGENLEDKIQNISEDDCKLRCELNIECTGLSTSPIEEYCWLKKGTFDETMIYDFEPNGRKKANSFIIDRSVVVPPIGDSIAPEIPVDPTTQLPPAAPPIVEKYTYEFFKDTVADGVVLMLSRITFIILDVAKWLRIWQLERIYWNRLKCIWMKIAINRTK